MRKKIKATSVVISVKSLDPKDPDTKYFGNEPVFDADIENRGVLLPKHLHGTIVFMHVKMLKNYYANI